MVTLENCLLSSITTAGFNTIGSPCYEHYIYCKNVLEGTIERDDLFIFIAEMDKDDDPFNEENWYKCNPTLQYNKTTLKNFRINAQMAKEKGGNELSNFLVKMCNKWLNGSLDSKYLQSEDILKCKSDKDIEFLRGKSVVCGLDLSSGNDLTSIALELKYIDDDGKTKYFIHQHSFMPKMRMEEHERMDKQPYKIWHKKGLISITEGSNLWKTDYKFIISYLKEIIEKYDIKIDGIYYDNHNASTFLQDLEEITENLIEVKQSCSSLNDATIDLALEIKAGNVEFNKDDDLIVWSLSNATLTRNSFDEVKIDKTVRKDRIDVVDSIIDAHKGIFKNTVSVDINKHVTSWLDKLGW